MCERRGEGLSLRFAGQIRGRSGFDADGAGALHKVFGGGLDFAFGDSDVVAGGIFDAVHHGVGGADDAVESGAVLGGRWRCRSWR